MAYENIRLELEGPVAILTVDRPKSLNALNLQTFRELESALDSLGSEVRALIVTGGGEKAFVAGADILEMASYDPAQGRAFSAAGQHVFERLESLSIPTIAAVNGFALGGGLELALGCDLIYASQKAKFGMPEVGLGVIPGFGGTQRLSRLIGRGRAKELIFTGDTVDAARALELGLVLQVLPPEGLMQHCRDVAQKLLKKGPLALSQAKRVIGLGADVDLRTGAELECQAFGGLFGSAEQQEGMKAFLEKRSARFQTGSQGGET